MKFLTREVYDAWYGAMLDDRPMEAACKAYREHLQSLRAVLPAEVVTLGELRGVDDGLVVEVHHVRSQATLILVLRCGDLLMGYYDLLLTYAGADISARDEQTLAEIARSTRADTRYDSDVFHHELDFTEDRRIEHRLMFHPGRWFAICCSELRWEKIDRPDRALPRLRDWFPGGPPSRIEERRRKRLRSAPSR